MWSELQSNLVYGENIAQTLHYAATGNASFALIANSQLKQAKNFHGVCAIAIDAGAHGEISQQVVELTAASDAALAGQFLEFLRGPESRAVISAHGYQLPELQ
jgi:molybdate transport system substrate-binding protein